MLDSVKMPQNAAKNRGPKKPPGGRRVGDAEVQRRLDHADKMLREGKSRAEVVDSMVSTFGLSTRAADSYIARTRERWAEDSKGVREVERGAALARLDRLSGKAEMRGQFGAAVSAEKLRAQVTGLLVPQAVEVKATIATTTAEPPMTMEQVAEEMGSMLPWVASCIRDGTLKVSAAFQADVRELAELVGLLSPSSPARALPPRG
jgi:hypothetical protein